MSERVFLECAVCGQVRGLAGDLARLALEVWTRELLDRPEEFLDRRGGQPTFCSEECQRIWESGFPDTGLTGIDVLCPECGEVLGGLFEGKGDSDSVESRPRCNRDDPLSLNHQCPGA